MSATISSRPSSSSHPSTTKTLHIGTRNSRLALLQVDLFTSALSALHPALDYKIHPLSVLGDRDKTTPLHAFPSQTPNPLLTAPAPNSNDSAPFNTSDAPASAIPGSSSTPGGLYTAQNGGTGPAKALWTEELEVALLTSTVDVIVHCVKDMPTSLPHGCVLGGVSARADPRDVVVISQRRLDENITSLRQLVQKCKREGKRACVGTSSVRRKAWLRNNHGEGVVVKDVRGNVPTRVRKCDDKTEGFDAIIVAGAGMVRLELGGRIAEWLGGSAETSTDGDHSSHASGSENGANGTQNATHAARTEETAPWLHAVGQGALGFEIRADDENTRALVEAVSDRHTWWECAAERSLLRTLEGGCSVPVGVRSWWESSDAEEASKPNTTREASVPPTGSGEQIEYLNMRASVISPDGLTSVSGIRTAQIQGLEDAEEFGWLLAGELVDKGAGEILKSIKLDRGGV